MGADLYRESITDKAQAEYGPWFDNAVEKRNGLIATFENLDPATPDGLHVKAKIDQAQAEVERYWGLMYPEDGYFRDSYNGSSLFDQLGLSWWSNDFEDRLDENGYLDVNGCKWLLAEVQSRKLKQTRGNTGKYFVEKKARLERFLQGAIEANEPIYCSV